MNSNEINNEIIEINEINHIQYNCEHCEQKFISKNKLFQHLSTHGIERDSIRATRPSKLILLVGWLSNIIEDDNDVWEVDGYLSHSWTTISNRIETELFNAIDLIDGNITNIGITSTRGLSRASSCAQRASHILQLEGTTHSVTDTFCFQISGKSKPKDREWLDSVNSKLPYDIRILEVYSLPSSYYDFHAEAACSQRVFEYVIPLHILFPPPDLESEHNIQLEERKIKEKIWCKMDCGYPRDTPQGKRRIENFRKLKVILKQFSGKQSYHNYTTGGASPEDGHVKRRVDRFYHKEMLSILPNKNLDDNSDDNDNMFTISDVCHYTIGADGKFQSISTSSELSLVNTSDNNYDQLSEDWAVLSISGNTFLKGQARKMIGLAIAVMWGWLPFSCIEASLDPQHIMKIPSAPGCGLYLSECRYDKWEAKSTIRFDPRRIEGGDVSRIDKWTRVVQRNAVKCMKIKGFEWMNQLEIDCKLYYMRYETERSLRLRTPEDLVKMIEPDGECYGIPSNLSPEISLAYEQVLNLLRSADLSGNWPLSSQARQKVIAEETLMEKGAQGGTFSVGFLPSPLAQPRGNELFPELLLACFKLEKILYPMRKPSSTIAINKHAQFLPHRDSGAGTGQDLSLIVGLGDYSGGELMVETIMHDIRYKPIEFDGWADRHWTLPFQGERYTLVWFTPNGVKIPEDLWWLDKI